jgi:hypothetical protein
MDEPVHSLPQPPLPSVGNGESETIAGRVFLSAVLSAGGPSLMCFPQFSAISRSRQKCSKQPKNEKNNYI